MIALVHTGTSRGGHAHLRSALAIGEIAVSLVLIVTSGLLLHGFEKMRKVDPGFRPEHARYYWLLLAEWHLNRRRFGAMLGRIALLPLGTG